MDDHVELLKYAAAAYVICIDDMIKLLTDKRIEVILSVLMEAKNSYGPPISPS